MEEGDDDRPQRRRPHPFFGWCAFAAVVAVLAAVDLDTGAPPAVALGSEWLHRLEVAGLAFLVLYALGVLLAFGYHGRSVSQLEFPAGGGIQLPAEGDLNRAARDIDEMVEGEEDRFAKLSQAVSRLDDRVTEIETREQP